jgi:hypothetical protein
VSAARDELDLLNSPEVQELEDDDRPVTLDAIRELIAKKARARARKRKKLRKGPLKVRGVLVGGIPGRPWWRRGRKAWERTDGKTWPLERPWETLLRELADFDTKFDSWHGPRAWPPQPLVIAPSRLRVAPRGWAEPYLAVRAAVQMERRAERLERDAAAGRLGAAAQAEWCRRRVVGLWERARVVLAGLRSGRVVYGGRWFTAGGEEVSDAG